LIETESADGLHRDFDGVHHFAKLIQRAGHALASGANAAAFIVAAKSMTCSVPMVGFSISRISTEHFQGAKLSAAADFMVMAISTPVWSVVHDKEYERGVKTRKEMPF